jgi:hypothetical protein
MPTVTVRSGNGTIGRADASIHFLPGPSVGDFSHLPTSADFADAQSGPAALLIEPNPAWKSKSTDSSAKWIGTSSGAAFSANTALFAVSFQVTRAFSFAEITVASAGVNAVYLNGTAICGNSLAYNFKEERDARCHGIAGLLHVGPNWLYFDVVNPIPPATQGSSLLFSGTITTSDTLCSNSVPVINAIAHPSDWGALTTFASGGWIVIYGSNFASGSYAWTTSDFVGNSAPTSLKGVSVSINGEPGYISYISRGN